MIDSGDSREKPSFFFLFFFCAEAMIEREEKLLGAPKFRLDRVENQIFW